MEEIVPVGSLDPENIHLPGIYVDQLVLGSGYEKRIERLCLAREQQPASSNPGAASRERIVKRAAQEFQVQTAIYPLPSHGVRTECM